ncbi:hypothetical protein M3201_10545 [Paenibacillus motobuensis]|uniref:hypothetical protein n=1 Tax=Paenibacillus TaxID=44249 RepID=UPI00203F0CE0|nr:MULTISPECIES: hypothetical protein [Paenibacillus]MCM3040135.1 hypothetical protein [Paenibacillus lutimineralis]MCM3647239.1 hypothetical protein [Paenibacillus motobuensis]
MSSPGKSNKARSGSSKNGNSNSKSSKSKQQKPGSIEAAVAALLLTGKLKVDSVELFREASVVISLIGQYKTLSSGNGSNIDTLVSFFQSNGDLTLNDVFAAMKKMTD